MFAESVQEHDMGAALCAMRQVTQSLSENDLRSRGGERLLTRAASSERQIFLHLKLIASHAQQPVRPQFEFLRTIRLSHFTLKQTNLEYTCMWRER